MSVLAALPELRAGLGQAQQVGLFHDANHIAVVDLSLRWWGVASSINPQV
jgi:hypothetical protein